MNKKELLKTISLKLLNLRKKMELSRPKMAGKIGLAVSSYYKNETGLNGPDVVTLHKLAERFKLSLDWLIMDRGEETYKSRAEIKNEAKEEFEAALKAEAASEPEPVPEPEKEALREDLKELMEHMDSIPLLRYEVLTMFHKFKESNKKMVEEAMKAE
jgi:transcriptional regulator with XRE-family HTH domain